MQRRTFLQLATGLVAVGLAGCGEDSLVATTTLDVEGTIDPELQVDDGVLGSAHGPSRVTANSFTTSISASTVGLLALEDGQGGVRGFALTFPDETPAISFESTALAVVFMEPGFLRLQIGPARDQVRAIRATAGFEPFVAYLRDNAGTPLDFLSGEPEFQQLRDAIVSSLGNPLLADLAEPSLTLSGDSVTITNPSPRFLTVLRDGQLLPDLVPPFGTLLDAPPLGRAPDYALHGIGTLERGDPADTLVDPTVLPSAFFASVLPLVELAAGRRVLVESAQGLLESLEITVPPLGAAAHLDHLLAPTLVQISASSHEALAESLRISFMNLSKHISDVSFPAGLGLSIGAILKFKQHKDNPTQIPIGTPIALLFIAAALLFFPSIIGFEGG